MLSILMSSSVYEEIQSSTWFEGFSAPQGGKDLTFKCDFKLKAFYTVWFCKKIINETMHR